MVEALTFESSEAGDVETMWRRFVPSARLDESAATPLAFRWSSVSTSGFDIVEYDLRADVRSTVDPQDQFMACRVSGADVRVGHAAGALDAGLPWLAGDRGAHAQWKAGARVRAFVFDRGFAERTARRVTGDDRLVLREYDASPRSVELGVHWERVFGHVAAAITSPGVDAIVEAELRRHALHTTLTAFSTSLSDARVGDQRRPAPAVVRRALAYMDSRAHEPITIDDVAAAAGVSTRGLQYAFRRALDTTPAKRLRDIRLAAAHEDLRLRRGGTVREVARRWGFTNAARFAAEHRHAYGVGPRETWQA